MNKAQRDIRPKTRVLEHAVRIGNVRKTWGVDRFQSSIVAATGRSWSLIARDLNRFRLRARRPPELHQPHHAFATATARRGGRLDRHGLPLEQARLDESLLHPREDGASEFRAELVRPS